MNNLILTLLLLSSVITGCVASKSQSIEDKQWFIAAKNYIEFDQTISHKNNKFMDIYKKREIEKDAVIRTSPPNEVELDQLLRSNDENCKKIALINIHFKNLYFPKIVDNILDQYSAFDEMGRFYAQNSLKIIPVGHIDKYDNKIVDALLQEKSKSLNISGLSLIKRINPFVGMPYFIMLFKSQDEEIKTAAYVTANEIGSEFLMQIEDKLKTGIDQSAQ